MQKFPNLRYVQSTLHIAWHQRGGWALFQVFMHSFVQVFIHSLILTHPPSHTHTHPHTHTLTHTHTDDKKKLSCDLHQLQGGGGYRASEEPATSIHRKKHQHRWHGGLPHRCWCKCTIHDVTRQNDVLVLCQTTPTEWHNSYFLDLLQIWEWAM